jgi:hypothetical protein
MSAWCLARTANWAGPSSHSVPARSLEDFWFAQVSLELARSDRPYQKKKQNKRQPPARAWR